MFKFCFHTHIRHTMLYSQVDISLTWIAHNIYSKPTVKKSKTIK